MHPLLLHLYSCKMHQPPWNGKLKILNFPTHCASPEKLIKTNIKTADFNLLDAYLALLMPWDFSNNFACNSNGRSEVRQINGLSKNNPSLCQHHTEKRLLIGKLHFSCDHRKLAHSTQRSTRTAILRLSEDGAPAGFCAAALPTFFISPVAEQVWTRFSSRKKSS